jgi:predicted Fe-Mo cluster-binding NifX family protein
MSEQLDAQTHTQKRVIAVPCLAPGGLDATRSGHFGHCECFTLVEVGDDSSLQTRVVENTAHQEGGCLNPVKLLASLGTTDIAVGGMGARPLGFFEDMGIAVYVDQELSTVREVVDAVLRGDLPVMTPMHVCGGGGGSCH